MSVFAFMVFLFLPREVILASTGYDVQLPSRITALSGSCVQIPCMFNIPNDRWNSVVNIFGFWTKTYHELTSMVFSGSTNITKKFSRIEIIGNLKQRNCTTVFYDVNMSHTDKYYFRVDITPNNEHSFTYSNNPVYVSVSDVPQAPVLNSTDLKAVMEETTVNLSCSAEAPCPEQPPNISWSYIPQSANITTKLQENPDKTQSMFSIMTFKASYKDPIMNISCTAAYPRNTSNNSTVETTVTLQVLFSPKETNITIDPSASVSVDTNVTLTCKSKANPSDDMNFTWYKSGQEEHLGLGEQLTFNVNSRSGGLYFCKAENKFGAQNSSEIQLMVTNSVSSRSLSLIAGCVGGLSAFLCLLLLVTLCLRVRRVKASIIKETDVSDQGEKKHVEISSIYTNCAFETSEETEIPKDDNDVIHYGEIDFAAHQTKSTVVKASGPETIYAMVSGPEKTNQD